MGIIGKAIERIKLRILLRDEYNSTFLRDWFAQDFGVEVGLYSYGCFDRWRIPARTRIGRYCSFAKSCRILDANHPIEAISTHPFFYESRLGVVDHDRVNSEWLIIQDDVWISHNATIAPTCKFIGRGAIIGAGAIVTGAVAPYTIVAGVPAKKLRDRFQPDLIAAIEATRWWEYDIDHLRRLVAEAPNAVFSPTAAVLKKLVDRQLTFKPTPAIGSLAAGLVRIQESV